MSIYGHNLTNLEKCIINNLICIVIIVLLIIFDIIIFQVEGIGKKFLPAGYDRSIADKWYKTGDKEGFDYARRLIKQEGLLCGKDSKQSYNSVTCVLKSIPTETLELCREIVIFLTC